MNCGALGTSCPGGLRGRAVGDRGSPCSGLQSSQLPSLLHHAGHCPLTRADTGTNGHSYPRFPHMHRAQADSRNPHWHSRRSSPAVLRSTMDWDHTGNWPEAHLLFLPLLRRQVLAQGKQGAGGIHQHSLSAPWSTQCLLSVHTGICPVSTGIALPGKRLPPCFVLQLVNVTLELFP